MCTRWGPPPTRTSRVRRRSTARLEAAAARKAEKEANENYQTAQSEKTRADKKAEDAEREAKRADREAEEAKAQARQANAARHAFQVDQALRAREQLDYDRMG